MDDELRILSVYKGCSPTQISNFNKRVQSNYRIDYNSEKQDVNFEWLELMESTIIYIDNILRNPNRFIVNEEEVVKVEQARRITVESIKHLAKHTNLIQEITEDDEVKPSKILNINKDESYNTYENRVIYTLIQDMASFVDLKKRNLITSSYFKGQKKCEYQGTAQVGNESVSISMSMETREMERDNHIKKGEGTIEQRIAKLEERIADLRNTQVYRTLAKDHVARIIPPIKKTNLILKNTNFQYAMKLWDFLKAYRDDEELKTKKNTTYKDDKIVQGMFDDTFLLNYLLVSNIGNENRIKKFSKEEVERMTDNLITKIVELNADLKMTDLQQIIGAKIAVIRNKREASLSEIENKFNSKLQGVIDKILSFNFR